MGLTFFEAIALVVAIFLPPLGLLIFMIEPDQSRFVQGTSWVDFFVDILLTILGWIPGVIYAWYIIISKRKEKRPKVTKNTSSTASRSQTQVQTQQPQSAQMRPVPRGSPMATSEQVPSGTLNGSTAVYGPPSATTSSNQATYAPVTGANYLIAPRNGTMDSGPFTATKTSDFAPQLPPRSVVYSSSSRGPMYGNGEWNSAAAANSGIAYPVSYSSPPSAYYRSTNQQQQQMDSEEMDNYSYSRPSTSAQPPYSGPEKRAPSSPAVAEGGPSYEDTSVAVSSASTYSSTQATPPFDVTSETQDGTIITFPASSRMGPTSSSAKAQDETMNQSKQPKHSSRSILPWRHRDRPPETDTSKQSKQKQKEKKKQKKEETEADGMQEPQAAVFVVETTTIEVTGFMMDDAGQMLADITDIPASDHASIQEMMSSQGEQVLQQPQRMKLRGPPPQQQYTLKGSSSPSKSASTSQPYARTHPKSAEAAAENLKMITYEQPQQQQQVKTNAYREPGKTYHPQTQRVDSEFDVHQHRESSVLPATERYEQERFAWEDGPSAESEYVIRSEIIT